MQTPRRWKNPLIFILPGSVIVIIAVVALVVLKPFSNSVKEDIWAVEPSLRYNIVIPFGDGMAQVEQDGKWGIISKEKILKVIKENP